MTPLAQKAAVEVKVGMAIQVVVVWPHLLQMEVMVVVISRDNAAISIQECWRMLLQCSNYTIISFETPATGKD